MKGRTWLQLAVIVLVWGVAYLDFLQPGQWQFYDPIPWSTLDGVLGDWGRCPGGDAIQVPGIPAMTQFFETPSTLEDWRRRLGSPTCHKDQTFTWELQAVWGTNLYLRITFQDNQAVRYDFIRGQDRESTSTPAPQPGLNRPELTPPTGI